jgi:cobyrinic acid a,c-diamide synthase
MAGAQINFFSPLGDQVPSPTADAVFLPGGYPELYAGALAANAVFLTGLRDAAARGLPVYGECGGFMVLGKALTDADGASHEMAGLLALETSFAKRGLSLGYRLVRTLTDTPFGSVGTVLRGHEFHYATLAREGTDHRVFMAENAEGKSRGSLGLSRGSVLGSFIHLIDRAG